MSDNDWESAAKEWRRRAEDAEARGLEQARDLEDLTAERDEERDRAEKAEARVKELEEAVLDAEQNERKSDEDFNEAAEANRDLRAQLEAATARVDEAVVNPDAFPECDGSCSALARQREARKRRASQNQTEGRIEMIDGIECRYTNGEWWAFRLYPVEPLP